MDGAHLIKDGRRSHSRCITMPPTGRTTVRVYNMQTFLSSRQRVTWLCRQTEHMHLRENHNRQTHKQTDGQTNGHTDRLHKQILKDCSDSKAPCRQSTNRAMLFMWRRVQNDVTELNWTKLTSVSFWVTINGQAVGRPQHLYPKANVRLAVPEKSDFPE